MTIPMVLNLGLSGQPFAGPDIGGFAGAGDGALFARWMGFGALLPFARGHTEQGQRPQGAVGVRARGRGHLPPRPGAALPAAARTCTRCSARRRETGLPVCAAAVLRRSGRSALRDVDDAALIGRDLMVVAQTSPDRDAAPALPRGDWRDVTQRIFGTDDDPDLPRLYVRDGAIVPLGEPVEHTDLSPGKLTLLANPDAHGDATGFLYEDDDDGFGYRDGDYHLLEYRFDAQDSLDTELVEGSRPNSRDKIDLVPLRGDRYHSLSDDRGDQAASMH